jgi:hypothetical protein
MISENTPTTQFVLTIFAKLGYARQIRNPVKMAFNWELPEFVMPNSFRRECTVGSGVLLGERKRAEEENWWFCAQYLEKVAFSLLV